MTHSPCRAPALADARPPSPDADLDVGLSAGSTQLPSQATSITSSSCTYNSSTDRVTCPISNPANDSDTATCTAITALLIGC